MIKKTFQEENNEALSFILNERFFKPWLNKESQLKKSELEIYITNDCNQKCEYCYLCDNNNLYPPDKKSEENILNNYKLLLNFLLEKQYNIKTVEFYSGEIWQSNFGYKIFDLTYEYLLKGLKWESVIIPSNCSFVLKQEKTEKIQSYINKFKTVGVPLLFSISVDGKIIENINRPLKNGIIKDDNYYDNLFMFAKHNNFFFHPMVAAVSIEKWKENYFWWKEMCKKYDMDFFEAVMCLEVRNNDWTSEKIKHYEDFLELLIEENIQHFKNNKIEKFARYLLGSQIEDTDKIKSTSYIPYLINTTSNCACCSIPNCLTVRLGDLAICPCHRLATEHLLYGYFIVENNNIIGIKENNFYMANRVLMANNNLTHLKCDTCIYSSLCIKGCFGSQFETRKDPFLAIESVCDLQKAKIQKVIEVYEKKGVIDYFNNIQPDDVSFIEAKKYLRKIKEIKEYEEQ